MLKPRRCSFLPVFCSSSVELMPAKEMRPSREARFASDVTESSSLDRSISAATCNLSLDVVSSRVCSQSIFWYCYLFALTYDLVADTMSSCTSTTTNDKISAVVWVKVRAVDGIRQGRLGIRYRRHDR